MMRDYDIYPKQFKTRNLPVIKNSCFVLMSFSQEFDLVYGKIKDALSKHGYSCKRCDEISASKPIISDILTGIMTSQFVVVDISGSNPNVFYELGIAHVFKDARNVFLIKDRESHAPFDINHLRYHEYDRSNLGLLTSTVLDFFDKNTVLVRFHEALNMSGIIDYVKCDMDQFVSHIQASMGDSQLNMLSDLIMGIGADTAESDAERLLLDYESLMSQQISMGIDETSTGLLRVYFELLGAMSHYGFSAGHVRRFLGSYFNQFGYAEEDYLAYQIDCAVSLVGRGCYLEAAMPWIVEYFSRSKTANIDLNRYKLESLLTTSRDPGLDEHIVNAIMNENCYIREHFSDISGTKRLASAYPVLITQLRDEDNYYSANSMIVALGRIGNAGAIDHIMSYIRERIDSIVSTRSQFILNHARAALMMLDDESGEALERFELEFGSKVGDRNYL